MAARVYSLQSLAAVTAARTNTALLALSTNGFGASSLRYLEIEGLPEAAYDQLREDDITFVTFDTPAEAAAAYDRIVESYPRTSPLCVDIVLALPNSSKRARLPIL